MANPAKNFYLILVTIVLAFAVIIFVVLLPDDKTGSSKNPGGYGQPGGTEILEKSAESSRTKTTKLSPGGMSVVRTENSETNDAASSEINDNPTAKSISNKSIFSDDILFYEKLNETLRIKNPKDRTAELSWLGEVAALHYKDSLPEILNDLSKSEDQREFVKGVLSGLTQKSHEEALTWLDSIENNSAKYNGYLQLAKIWATDKPGETAVWAKKIPNPNLRTSVYEEIASTWASQDMEGAYEWVLQITDAKLQSKVLVKVGTVAAEENPSSAAEWALQFEDSRIKDQLLGLTIDSWAKTDIDGAANWIDSLLDKNVQDTATGRLLSYWVLEQPQKAAQWADDIPDDDSRLKALETVARTWAKKSPNEAKNWTQEFNDPVLRKHLLEVIEEFILMQNE